MRSASAGTALLRGEAQRRPGELLVELQHAHLARPVPEALARQLVDLAGARRDGRRHPGLGRQARRKAKVLRHQAEREALAVLAVLQDLERLVLDERAAR